MTTATSKLQIIIDIIGDKTASSSFDKMKSGIAAVGVAIGTLAAAGYTAKKAWDFAQEGAQLELIAGQFDNVATNAGYLSDVLLGKMREASGGLVTDAELMASGLQIIELGLADSEQGVVDLATVVSALGLDMQQVIMTFANNSEMRLDALGLSVENVKNRAAELNAEGFDGDAFDQAVLEGLIARVDLLGDSSETTAGKMAIVETRIQNMINAAKTYAAVDIAAPMFEEFDAINALADAYNSGLISKFDYLKATTQLTTGVQIGGQAIMNYNEAMAISNEQDRMAAVKKAESEQWQTVLNQSLSDGVNTTEAYVMTQSDYIRTLSESNSQLDFYRMRSEEAAKASQVHGQYIRDNLEVTQDATLAQSAFNETLSTTASEFGSINTSMSNTIQSLIEQAQFLAAGGDTIVAATEAIKASAQGGEISFDDAANQLQKAGIAALDLEQELTDMPVDELTEKLMGLGLGPAEAEAQAAELVNTLYEATSQEWLIDVIMNVQGELPSGVAPGTDSPVPEDTGGSEPIETAPGGGQTPQGGGVQVQVQQPLDVYQVADEVAKIMVR